ncbi:MAG: hypothetical protein JWN62_1910 [Acidimicrobiales bacterium]|nr:hypothetical protein [Acidimicrobiales bacterium]
MSARRTSGRTFAAAAMLGVSLIGAACSSDDNGAATTTPATIDLPTSAPKAPEPTTTTTASTTPSTATLGSDVETTTTVATVPTYPLTGLPVTDLVNDGRRALVVKIDNHPDARPQKGLNEADIVFEENVENLTRFAAVFHSTNTDIVGPIRSGRTQDVDLLGSLNKPIFIWSGGNAKVSAAINSSDLVPVDETRAGQAMFRDHGRKAPHNLYGTLAELYKFTPPDGSPPAQQFLYRPAGAATPGDAADGVKVSMDGIRVRWQWDPATGKYLRFSDEKVHSDAVNGDQVFTNNVVVLNVAYKPSAADEHSPEAQTEGYGVAWVFTAGKVIKGSWVRADRLQPFTLADGDGNPILLTPGHTFIELARPSTSAVIPAGSDASAIPYP